MNRAELLRRELDRRVLVADGAMGTMLSGHEGCPDRFVLSHPDRVMAVHDAYLSAGADIITTYTFNANSVALKQYGLGACVDEINIEGVRIARQAVDSYEETHPGSVRFVAGSMGSVPEALSHVGGDSGRRKLMLAEAYASQTAALIDAGVDLLILETVYDLENLAVSLNGIDSVRCVAGKEVPLVVSAAIAGDYRLHAGGALADFVEEVSAYRPLVLGLNCCDIETLAGGIERLSGLWHGYLSAMPNAGMPDAAGHYAVDFKKMAGKLGCLADKKLINIAGGCCGTGPDYIRAIVERI